MRTLVLGVGNPLRGDDGVGPVVAERLCKRLGPNFAFVDFCGAGIDVFDWLSGYARLIIIDAIKDERLGEGECCRIEPSASNGWQVDMASHRGSILDVLSAAPAMGVQVPESICWYGIGVGACDEFREGLSEAMARALPTIVEQIRSDLENAGLQQDAERGAGHDS